jgi:hypothetical protein
MGEKARRNNRAFFAFACSTSVASQYSTVFGVDQHAPPRLVVA